MAKKVVSRIHFPVVIEETLNPPNFVERENMTYDQIRMACDSAKDAGLDAGALVIRLNPSFISAGLYYWGVVSKLNRMTPTNGKRYEGPIQVIWFGEASVRTSNEWPEKLYLVSSAPTTEDIRLMTEDMRAVLKERNGDTK